MSEFYRVTTKYVCGIDLHARTLTAAVMTLEGTVLARKSLDCKLDRVMEFLKPFLPDITVGVESTYNWYWLVDGLNSSQVTCVLGHALYIKRAMNCKHKNDPVDAAGIADLLRSNRFPLAYAYPAAMRAVRDLLRRRHLLVRRRAGTMTHFQCTLHQDGYVATMHNSLQQRGRRESLIELGRDEDTRRILHTDMEYIKDMDEMVDGLDKHILGRACDHDEKHLRILRSMPGCGQTTALTILYETHTIKRFRSPQRYSSYCRVVRADNESGGKNLGGSKNDKIGNPHLKWALSEIGAAMIRVSKRVCAWHATQAAIHGAAGAHARLRHKIAVAVYHMLKHDTVFDMDRFLGTQRIDQTESPAHNGTEPSGQHSEPSGLIGAPSGLSSDDSACRPSVTQTAATPKKRGRPPLPRDSQGNIIRSSPGNLTKPVADAAAGADSEHAPTPSDNDAAPKRKRGRPALARDCEGNIIRDQARGATTEQLRRDALDKIAGLSITQLSTLLSLVHENQLAETNPGRPSRRTTGNGHVLTPGQTPTR